MSLQTVYASEREKIIREREANPDEGPYKLARRLVVGHTAGYRPFYSVLSVIRRYDAAKKKAARA